jgi:hypothetical protein
MGGQGPRVAQIPSFAIDSASIQRLRLKSDFSRNLKLFLPVQPCREK